MPDKNNLVKPYLKWAGGKRQLLPEIKKHLPKDFNNYTYYEPFIGAGAVFFELQPQKAVINDSNEQLILTYKAIRDSAEALIMLLDNHQKNNCKEYFYETRNIDRNREKFHELTAIEKAARMIFLNKTCYNVLYRVNSHGYFNVPYGRYKNPAICEDSVLRQISNYLRTNEIYIVNNDFEQAVSTADRNSFIYFDPPYHSQSNSNFTGYQADGFRENDHERLCNTILKMTNRGVKCLLSNSDTQFIRKLYNYDFFELIPVQARRAINSSSAGRGNVNELLIKNWIE